MGEGARPRSPAGRLPVRLLQFSALAFGALVAFLMAEVGVRLFVDFQALQPGRVLGIDPEHPTAFLPGVSHRYQTEEFDYTVRFNRFGRRDVEWDAAAIANPANILFIGDSFVLGNGLEHEQAIPTQLERLLGDGGVEPEVFNFGLPGGGPREYARLLAEALEQGFAASTVVVMLFVGNDFYPAVIDDPVFDVDRRKELIRKRESAPDPPMTSHLVKFVRVRLSQSTTAVSWALRLGNLLGRSLYSSPSTYVFQRELTPAQQQTLDTILDSVGVMKRSANDAGRQLFLVTLPNRIQVENAAALTNATMDAHAPNLRIAQVCATLEVECLDLLPLLQEEAGKFDEVLYYPVDRHLTPAGAELAATAIAEFLIERKR